MATVSGQGTTYNLPNFTGELFGLSTEDTPFLSAIGGLHGGESANGAPLFTWSTYDLRDADATRQRKEGADAPAGEERSRGTGSNVLEIHQEAVELSYTKLAATNYISGGTKVAGSNVVQDERTWQLQQAIKQIARDVELSFLTNTGTGIPASNATARKTQGLIGAITTNVVATAAGVALSADDVLDAMQAAYDNGGLNEGETRTLITGSKLKRELTKLFIDGKSYQEQTRNVGGVNLQTIESDFGRVNIMLDRYVPSDTLIIASLDECRPVFLDVPGKGRFFAEPLAKTGAADKVQLYGEIGLNYGLEKHHAKVTVTPAP